MGFIISRAETLTIKRRWAIPPEPRTPAEGERNEAEYWAARAEGRFPASMGRPSTPKPVKPRSVAPTRPQGLSVEIEAEQNSMFRRNPDDLILEEAARMAARRRADGWY